MLFNKLNIYSKSLCAYTVRLARNMSVMCSRSNCTDVISNQNESSPEHVSQHSCYLNAYLTIYYLFTAIIIYFDQLYF